MTFYSCSLLYRSVFAGALLKDDLVSIELFSRNHKCRRQSERWISIAFFEKKGKLRPQGRFCSFFCGAITSVSLNLRNSATKLY